MLQIHFNKVAYLFYQQPLFSVMEMIAFRFLKH